MNITVADNLECGLMFLNTDYSNSNVTIQNVIIVGSSNNNGDNTTSPFGLSVPYSVKFKASRVTYYRFFSGTATVVSSNNLIPDYIMSFFEKIRYSNMNGQFVSWNGFQTIFVDLDGSLTRTFFDGMSIPPHFSNATAMPSMEFNLIPNRCYRRENTRWGNSIICDSRLTPRTVVLNSMNPSYYWYSFYMTRVDPDTNAHLSNSSAVYMAQTQYSSNSWAINFVPGYTYQMRMEHTYNFMHLSLASKYMLESDMAVILRFMYTESRELFEIKRIVAGVSSALIVPQTDLLNVIACTAGDYYQNHSASYVDICVTARQKPPKATIDVTGVICRQFCPVPLPPAPSDPTNQGGGDGVNYNGSFVVKESFMRVWSNVTQWPRGTLPEPGDNVTIPF